MARAIESCFICGGRYRILWVKPLGGHPQRIIEIEDVDRRRRFHGSDAALARLAFSIKRAHAKVQPQGRAGA
jgi:hypothetical protein